MQSIQIELNSRKERVLPRREKNAWPAFILEAQKQEE